MKANYKKLTLAMARACMDTRDLEKASQLPHSTLNNVIMGVSVRPSTIGRVARALGVDVTEILEDEEGE